LRRGRIHYFVHGHGRGHAVRTLPIVGALRREGFGVRVHAGDAAQALFLDELDLVKIESVLPRPKRGEYFAATSEAGTARRIAKRVAGARAVFASDRPDLVITDGDLPGALAALAQRVPSIAVGHGLVFSHCRRPHGLPARLWLAEAPKAVIASVGARARVAVNFAPVTPRSRSTFVGAPTLRSALDGKRASGQDIVCYFHVGDPRAVVDAIDATGTRPRVFSPPEAGLGERAEPIDEARFTAALLGARVVFGNAGSQLISECVALGIPCFGVYHEEFREQALNVAMLRAHGIGDGISFERFEPEAIARFLSQSERLRERLRSLAPMPLAADLVLERALALSR
jgi:UDP-N-acetylglucosamine--N-acetylmuramyl-(pentapeptide) pyrophosphoryl-undecaprenol N-acetylglucosamine transferase